MRKVSGIALAFIVMVGLACASKRVLVPARMDLHPYGKIGLVTFTVENAKGNLHQFATERFAENVLAAQPGIEILELGNVDTMLQRLGEREVGITAAQELGKRYGVTGVFAGHLKITNPAATGGIAGILNPRLEATIRTDLTVRLLSAQSGGTVWRQSAWATEKVGGVSITGGQVVFGARDPKTAYGPMVSTIVNIVTRELWATWQKQ
jgi:hypothetical protein